MTTPEENENYEIIEFDEDFEFDDEELYDDVPVEFDEDLFDGLDSEEDDDDDDEDK